MDMDEVKRVFITLVLIVATGYVCASETDDSNLLFSHPMFQQLSARLSALEEQSKLQQDRITELESRELDHQKQDKIQQHRIEELESCDLAQQKTIPDLEAAIRNQQRQMKEMNRSLTEVNQSYHYLQDVVLAPKNDEIIENDMGENNEDSSTDQHRILARRQQPDVENVAFTAVLVHPQNDLGLNQNVVFDNVETNIGNAYNPHHGVFIAPVAGTYVFHVSVFSLNNDEAWCKMVVNGVAKADAYARGGADHHDQGSQTLVVRLNQGDDVAIQNGRAHDNVFGNPDPWTTFSGFLLRSDADINTILG